MNKFLLLILLGALFLQQGLTQKEGRSLQNQASRISQLKRSLAAEQLKNDFIIAYFERDFERLKQFETGLLKTIRFGIYNDSVLLHAVRAGDAKMVRFLIQAGADISERNDIGTSPVSLAYEDYDDLIFLIMVNELNFTIQTCTSQESLFQGPYIAIAQDVKGKVYNIPTVLKDANIGFIKDRFSWNFLHYSVLVGNHHYAKQLLENGYPADSKALAIAVEIHDQKMVDLLADYGAQLPPYSENRSAILSWVRKNKVALRHTMFGSPNQVITIEWEHFKSIYSGHPDNLRH